MEEGIELCVKLMFFNMTTDYDHDHFPHVKAVMVVVNGHSIQNF